MPASGAPRPCSIADALALVGEKHSLLVLREVCLGNGRFEQLVRNIGAPRDVLATRLRRLVDAGILHKHVYSERPQRFEYRPTQAGLELEPVLMTLMAWGDRHLRKDDDRPMVIEHSCGHELVPVVTCTACAGEVRHEDLTARPQSPGWSVTGPTAR
ncbi:winged helix-turn-helix transcriptional regulator [Streptomyces europaeiscabiei]|uniref:Helix-turn-helix domain-containing protein n=1 Tax=Streptomyces europaeiscabiei TaxID=146819 RepID=A0ABU4NQ81_9ACTN|nr:helix-turn-helix domain-containing protein [Streptomyces europaeiscabiei]MDX2529296.1 helix-turn-helix domain-containing protein [Streptomyces europaeiscabiei]MDX2761771.1 helix-turn-helix domain-containing protein [Streptomyces europaeiscabiei]MDX2768458.1 helix-turn-helix domain-containing protein [Streptomyces europaeiscabiei]MDX3546397.1 helix-turn-helix domain-containing protein [Streptomyces europaeiscabiei]MDX3556091.1 helix-turn-helix domain-containing protein [Streptomyces europaei